MYEPDGCLLFIHDAWETHPLDDRHLRVLRIAALAGISDVIEQFLVCRFRDTIYGRYVNKSIY